MKVIDIVKLSNKYLAGEQLTYPKLLPFLDAVIDDINSELNATFPSFTFLDIDGNPASDIEYDYFPDNYIRSVVCLGAATKFYLTDEEGVLAAEGYEMTYRQNLFYMVRDYIDHVPKFFQSDSKGGVRQAEERYVENHLPFDFHIWR